MNEVYHVLNRGVEKRNIFLDDKDYIRFIHNLYSLNDKKTVDPNHRFGLTQQPRDLLVNIHAWCLMKNHYHLLVTPTENNPEHLSLFMKKINMGYAKYFNEKYKRSGYLWQGKYKKILIRNDSHFLYIPYYIHCNPLDYKFKEWREEGVTMTRQALKYLQKYRWGSHLDYLGINNFPSIINKELFTEKQGGVLGTPKQYHKSLLKFLKKEKDFSFKKIQVCTLELE